MKDNSAGTWSECDGCDRDVPYAEDFTKFGWHHSEELDLDLCPSCFDRLSDFGVEILAREKALAKERAKVEKPRYYFIVPAELGMFVPSESKAKES